MICKNLLRATPVALLMLAALTAPTAHAAQGVGTYAEATCTATDATAEAWSFWATPTPPTFHPHADAEADGSGVGGYTLSSTGPISNQGYYDWERYQATYVQATYATGTASNDVGSVAAACQFDPFDVINVEPTDLERFSVGCRAEPGDAVRHLEGRVGVDEAGTPWVVGDDFAHPLGTFTAGTAGLEAPELAWTDAVFEADFSPDGCSVVLG